MYVHCTSMSANLNCTYNVRTLYVQCPLGSYFRFFCIRILRPLGYGQDHRCNIVSVIILQPFGQSRSYWQGLLLGMSSSAWGDLGVTIKVKGEGRKVNLITQFLRNVGQILFILIGMFCLDVLFIWLDFGDLGDKVKMWKHLSSFEYRCFSLSVILASKLYYFFQSIDNLLFCHLVTNFKISHFIFFFLNKLIWSAANSWVNPL